MPKSLSKLTRKVPPFRNIYVQLDKLKQDNKKLREEYKALEKANQKLQKDAAKLKKTLSETKKELAKDIDYYYYKGLHPDQYEENLKEWYHDRTGKVLDLEHPKTYNEKIQWMKLNDSTSLKTRLADKYLVREWVSEKIGSKYLIPLLGVYDKFDEIDFDSLPDKFVIKTNHAYATNWIVSDKSQFDYAAAKKFFDFWMHRNFAWYGLQLHYKDIEPKILIEEYLENKNDNLDDYKVFCFDGKAFCIEYMTGRSAVLRSALYDTEWNLMPCRRTAETLEHSAPRPENLEEMISLAETLSEGFSHVRVDFYILNNGDIKFGEMTFTTGNGQGAFIPDEYDRIFGDQIKLPTDY